MIENEVFFALTLGKARHAAPDAFQAAEGVVEAIGDLAAAGSFVPQLLVLPEFERKGAYQGEAIVEPVTLACYLAQRLPMLAFAIGVSVDAIEPYNLARIASSADHVTRGRLGLFASQSEPSAGRRLTHRPVHRSPADEALTLLRDLWDSWEDSAFVRDKVSGQFVVPGRIHSVDHVGAAYSVKGPLNVARSPQGHPPLIARWSGVPDVLVRNADIVLVPEADAADIDAIRHRLGGGRQRRMAIDMTLALDATFAAPQAKQLAARIHGLVEAVRPDGVVLTPADGSMPAAVRVLRTLFPLFDRPPAPIGPGATLRERLGLPRPESRYAQAARSEVHNA